MAERASSASIKIGAFVLVALFLLVLGSLWMVGGGRLAPRRVGYKVWITNSAGLSEGDRVRVAGVPAGRIRRIELRADEQWPVEMQIFVQASVHIGQDATARIASEGILGAKYLELLPGLPGSPVLPEGSIIRGQPGLDIEATLGRLDEIAASAMQLTERTAGLLDQVSGELGPIFDGAQALLSDENANNLNQLLATLRTTLDESGPRLTALLARLEGASVQLEGGLDELPQITERTAALLEDLRRALGPEGERLGGTLDAAERSLTSAEEMLSMLNDNRDRIEASLADLSETISHFEEFSAHVKRRPFSLVRIKGEADRKPGDGVGAKR